MGVVNAAVEQIRNRFIWTWKKRIVTIELLGGKRDLRSLREEADCVKVGMMISSF